MADRVQDGEREAWNSGVRFALQMVNPAATAGSRWATWERHNPYPASSGVGSPEQPQHCHPKWEGTGMCANTAHVEPQTEEPKTCADCDHVTADHHKLHCEAPGGCDCPGGWRCPDHGWTLCGCTYAGGVNPETGSYDAPVQPQSTEGAGMESCPEGHDADGEIAQHYRRVGPWLPVEEDTK